MRDELGIPKDAIWLLNVGELIPRKNHETLIRAVAGINNIYLTIAGQGTLKKSLIELIYSLNVSDKIKLLGFRTDISEMCSACDIFVFSSFHEGLPVSLMEAMAGGCPIVCSDIRGNTDLIDENGGELFNPHSIEECQSGIRKILRRSFNELGKYNKKRVCEFEVSNITKIMEEIYRL